MEDEDDLVTANMALMLDREINKRVALALCDLLAPDIPTYVGRYLDAGDDYSAASELAGVILDALNKEKTTRLEAAAAAASVPPTYPFTTGVTSTRLVSCPTCGK